MILLFTKLLKKYWWILLILFLFIISIIIFLTVQNEINRNIEIEKQIQKQNEIEALKENDKKQNENLTKKMTSEQLSYANTLLSSGIVIDDDENDFAIPKGEGTDAIGRPDNHSPYPLGWNDIKRITFNSDNNTFYIRYDFYGEIPEEMVKIEGDEIRGVGGGVGLIKFISNSGTTNEGMWQFGVNWTRSTSKEDIGPAWTTEYEEIPGIIDVSGMASPGEADQFGETTYTLGMQGTYYGGIGYNYLIAAYPLSAFDIIPGSEIIFTIAVETNSKIYHHSSIDPLLSIGSEKGGKIINYVLGTNTYTLSLPNY